MGGGAKGVQAAPLGTLGSRRGGRRRRISGGRWSPAICADVDGAPVREGGSVLWVGLLRGWPEMGSPRRWGAGGARGSPARVLGELGRGRSAKARPRSRSSGWKSSLGVNSSYGWLGWWLHGEILLSVGNGDGGWCSGVWGRGSGEGKSGIE